MKVAVIGAGVIGLSCAWQLARAGAKVTLIDTQEPPTGASAAAGGWISSTVYPRQSQLNKFLTKSAGLYPDFIRALGMEVGFKKVGHLRVTPKENQAKGFAVDKALREDVPGALKAFCKASLGEGCVYRWNEGSHVLAPRLLLEALFKAGLAAGVEFLQADVTGIQGDKVFTSAGAKTFDAIVVATGYTKGWLKDLLGNQYRARPKRGEGIEVALPEGLILPTVLDTDDVYIVPRILEPKVYIGTLDEWVDNATLNPDAPEELLAQASRWLPALKEGRVTGHFVGVRTVPLNEGPIMGQHNENKHIFMALGFAGGGLKSAPLAGREITAQILGDLMPKNRLFSAE